MPAEGVILNVSAKFRRKRVTLIFLALRGGNKGHNLRGDVKGHTRQRVGPGPRARGSSPGSWAPDPGPGFGPGPRALALGRRPGPRARASGHTLAEMSSWVYFLSGRRTLCVAMCKLVYAFGHSPLGCI